MISLMSKCLEQSMEFYLCGPHMILINPICIESIICLTINCKGQNIGLTQLFCA